MSETNKTNNEEVTLKEYTGKYSKHYCNGNTEEGKKSRMVQMVEEYIRERDKGKKE